MNIDPEYIWFQQYGATPHFANVTIDLLRHKLPGQIIARNGDVKWLPISFDLTPFYCYVKTRSIKIIYNELLNCNSKLLVLFMRYSIKSQLYQNFFESLTKEWTSVEHVARRVCTKWSYQILQLSLKNF